MGEYAPDSTLTYHFFNKRTKKTDRGDFQLSATNYQQIKNLKYSDFRLHFIKNNIIIIEISSNIVLLYRHAHR